MLNQNVFLAIEKTSRGSPPQVFFMKGVLQNRSNLLEITKAEVDFNKVA